MIMYFLQRVSIACYAECCTSYSKSLSVRASVTRWCCRDAFAIFSQ